MRAEPRIRHPRIAHRLAADQEIRLRLSMVGCWEPASHFLTYVTVIGLRKALTIFCL